MASASELSVCDICETKIPEHMIRKGFCVYCRGEAERPLDLEPSPKAAERLGQIPLFQDEGSE